MLAETVREWTEPWVEQGIEKGRAEERALLCRQAARKFEAAAGEQLAGALADVTDPVRLAQVGEWIIECGTAVELFARPRRHAPPQSEAATGKCLGVATEAGGGAHDAGGEPAAVDRAVGRARGSSRAAPRNGHCCVAKRRASSRRLPGSSLPSRLADVTDPVRLAQVGEWIIECGTVAEFLARLADTPHRSG